MARGVSVSWIAPVGRLMANQGETMADQAPTEANYRVLLIGVDDYPRAALGGCVNDIDAMQRVLLGARMAAVKDRIRIRRLASPRPGSSHETTVPEQPATLENIRAALAELASDEVAAGDRVFIYYSGHGSRVPVSTPGGRIFHREALVPADYDVDPSGRRMLFDYEINERLRQIAERTRSVTFVLDCCHAAGATRDEGGADQRARFLDLTRVLGRVVPLPDPGSHGHAVDFQGQHVGGGRAADPGEQRLGGGVDDCHLVSACMNHEIAKEDVCDGVRHGLLTRALIATLEAATNIDLPTVTWARIWQGMLDHVEARNPWQHLWMPGNAGRAVFGGPPVEGDAGIPVRRTRDGYRIEAGTLASITPGAMIAVYGEQPAFFPRDVNTDRVGVLRVTDAKRAFATAEAVDAPFDLPPGARGRVIKAGTGARMRCGIKPRDPAIEAQLAGSDLLDLAPVGEEAPVRLERIDGQWSLTDDKHGPGTDRPALFTLRPGDIGCARQVLEHYRKYSLPLRVAERCTDLAGGLELRVLSCPDHALDTLEAQTIDLPEARSSGKDTYELQAGARVCFSVQNRSPHRLHVTLLNSAASGKVQLLGDQVIDADASFVFWVHNNLGSAFQMSPPSGVSRCIDRLVAIGRTAMGHDLKHLRVDKTFAQIVDRTRDASGKDFDAPDDTATLEHWTATEVVVKTSRP